MPSLSCRILSTLIAVVFLSGVLARPATAGMITARDMLHSRIEAPVTPDLSTSREAVAQQLHGYGVPLESARLRAAALSASELALVQQEIDSLPAGQSALSVLGILFLVLLVLELVGVTNIFNKL